MLVCVDFCVGYCSFRVNYLVGLEKACLRVNSWLSQIANEKKYRVGHKSTIFEKGHRPILIKITFLESAHHQLSNGICRFFWAFHDLPTNRADWPAKVTARPAGGRSLAVTCYWRHNLRRSSLHWTKRWTALNITLRVNDRYPKF